MLFAAITTNQPIRSKCSRLPDLHDFFPTNISQNFAITPNLDITPTPERIAGVTIVLQLEEYLGHNESEQGAVNLARTVLGARHRNGETWQGILEDIRAGGGMDNFIQNLPGAYPETPMDQFAIIPILDLHVGNFYLSFTNEVLYMLLTVVLVVFLFFVVTKKGGGKSVPNAWQSLVELIYDFVLNLEM